MPGSAYPLHGWIPYKLQHNAGEIECYWMDTFNAPYAEPFFDETITKLKGIPQPTRRFNSVSSLSMLESWGAVIGHVEPTAFIFHVSRCGSTLISQLLSTDDQNIVLPEVPLFDDILRLPFKKPGIGGVEVQRLLQTAVQFYGQKRTGAERQLFVKTDSWHIFFHRLLRQLYPDTPFILLYRTPYEVFNSHVKQRGVHAVPGLIEPGVFGFNADDVFGMDLNVYLARVLESYFGMYLNVAGQDYLTLLVNYSEGIMPAMDRIASFIKRPFRAGHYEKMMQRAGFHSKHPGRKFSENMVNDDNPLLKTAFGLYGRIEEKRLASL